MLPFMTTRRFYQITQYEKHNGELNWVCRIVKKKILILMKNKVN